MLVQDFLILDNTFLNPERILTFASGLKYHAVPGNNLTGITVDHVEGDFHRDGFLSSNLTKNFKEVSDKILIEMFHKFIDLKIVQNTSLFFHIGTSNSKNLQAKYPEVISVFKIFVFLNPNPPDKSGMLLGTPQGIIEIKNKFNRMVVFKSKLPFKHLEYFGNSFDDSRIVLEADVHHMGIVG